MREDGDIAFVSLRRLRITIASCGADSIDYQLRARLDTIVSRFGRYCKSSQRNEGHRLVSELNSARGFEGLEGSLNGAILR
jgi:hypothetical protein